MGIVERWVFSFIFFFFLAAVERTGLSVEGYLEDPCS